MRLNRPSLTRELGIVLAVKVALILALKLAFFSEPLRPDGDAVARALLTPASPSLPERRPAHE